MARSFVWPDRASPGINGGPPGDLLLHVRIEPHPLFRVVDEDDLELESAGSSLGSCTRGQGHGADARMGRSR